MASRSIGKYRAKEDQRKWRSQGQSEREREREI